MIHIAVCDDEQVERDYLSALARQWANARGIALRLSCHASAESFLFAREDAPPVDILLLDIQMREMDGVALARRLRAESRDIQILFITGYADHIAEGYDVSALHYLMKPVREDKLHEVLDRAVERLHQTEPALIVQTAEGAARIPLADILCVESFAHYIAIQTKKATHATRAGIGEIERSLGDAFIRCHRSYIVGLRHISHITKGDVVLDSGRTVPLSRRLYTQVNLAFIAFHRERRH